MDHHERTKLREIIETLTTSGESNLDQNLMRDLKSICRKSNTNVKECFDIVFAQLKYDHAQARLSSFLIIKDLSRRSKYFKSLLCGKAFQEFLELSIGHNLENPLPPPEAVAKNLREKSILFVKSLYEQFGSTSRYLSLGYEFLKYNVKIDFENLEQRNAAHEEEKMRRERTVSALNEKKYQKIVSSLHGFVQEVEGTLQQIVNCYKLLFPSHTIFLEEELGIENHEERDAQARKDLAQMNPEEFVSAHGLASRHYKLTINLSSLTMMRVIRDENNAAVLDSLGDSVALIGNRFVKTVTKWLTVLVKVKFEDADKMKEHERILKTIIDLKQKLKQAIEQYSDIDILTYDEATSKGLVAAECQREMDSGGSYVSSTSDDSDLEEVEGTVDPERMEKGKGVMFPRREWTLKKGTLFEDEKLPVGRKEFHAGTQSRSACTSASKWKENSFIGRRYEGDDPSVSVVFDSDYVVKGSIDVRESKGDWESSQMVYEDDTGEKKTMYLPYIPTQTEEKKKKTSEVVNAPENRSSPGLKAAKIDVKGKSKEDLLKDAPFVKYGPDLEYWDKEKIPLNTNAGFEELRRFWVMNDGDEGEQYLPDNEASKLRKRRMKFSEEIPEVKWSCRAPLPSGKLCARRDKLKCPFHGKIIPRNKVGEPNGEDKHEQIAREQAERLAKIKEEVPLWKLMQDTVEKETGVEMSVKRTASGRKRPKSKRNGLEDIDTVPENSRTRLKRKVLNPGALKKAAVTLDKIDEKRTRDKFSNTFLSL